MSPVHAEVQTISHIPQARDTGSSFPVIDEFELHIWLYRLAWPLMQVIACYVHVKKVIYKFCFRTRPKQNSWFFDGISFNGKKVKDGAKGWSALDAVYNFRTGEGNNLAARVIDDFWLRMRNAQAVRNRLIIVRREIINAVLRVHNVRYDSSPVRILSIAAGSGQAVIEAMERLERMGIRCEALFIDSDTSALEHSNLLAQQRGLSDNIVTREGDAVFFSRELKGFKPDIIEMCGLTDYLHDSLAIALIKKIRRHLQPGGYYLTCHIHPNAEMYFLRQVVNWRMLYRTREQLEELLVNGGFLAMKMHTEPHQIHSVAVAQKV